MATLASGSVHQVLDSDIVKFRVLEFTLPTPGTTYLALRLLTYKMGTDDWKMTLCLWRHFGALQRRGRHSASGGLVPGLCKIISSL